MNNRIHKGKIMLSHYEINNLNLYELTLLSCIKHIVISNYNSSEIKEIKLNDILTVLNNNKKLPRNNLRRDLSKSFKSLISKNIFNVVDKVGMKYYIKRESLLVNSDTLYVSITQQEFKDIFSSSLTSKTIKLYGYYIKLLSTFNIHTKIGFYSITSLSKKFNISERTIKDYNYELEKRNWISIYKRKTFDESTGKFRSFNNVYYKPCDKEYICNWFKIDL